MFLVCLHFLFNKLTVYFCLHASLHLVPNLIQIVVNSTKEGLQFNDQKPHVSHPVLLHTQKKVIQSLTSSTKITLRYPKNEREGRSAPTCVIPVITARSKEPMGTLRALPVVKK